MLLLPSLIRSGRFACFPSSRVFARSIVALAHSLGSLEYFVTESLDHHSLPSRPLRSRCSTSPLDHVSLPSLHTSLARSRHSHTSLARFARSQAARDACGTPLRPFWPYVKDPVSIDRIRKEQVFQVGACWNGIVAFPARLVAWQPSSTSTPDVATSTAVETPDATLEAANGSTYVRGMRKRGWQMVDNGTFPDS